MNGWDSVVMPEVEGTGSFMTLFTEQEMRTVILERTC